MFFLDKNVGNKYMEKVTVIIPVYNVEEYIETCLSSVIGQSYKNLEIICVDDCSTDSSYAICCKVKKKDTRIKVLQNESNSGLGYTRNVGVDAANGQYLYFLDSDDWIPEYAIEHLLAKSVESDSDMTVGAMSNYNQQTEEYITGWRDVDQAIALDTYLNWSMCNKLFKRTFYKENSIRQYTGIYEDAATYPIIKRLAKRVSLLHEVTYFYRRFTGKSIMDNWENALETNDSIDYMIENFITRKIETKDYCLFEAAFTLAKSSIYIINQAMNNGKCKDEIKREFVSKLERQLGEYFPEYGYEKIAVIGSANLNQIYKSFVLEYFPNDLKVPIFNFSSLISLTSKGSIDVDVYHNNTFRKNMVIKDFNKSLWDNIDGSYKIMLVDLLDERTDILQNELGFYTRSEAYDSAFVDGELPIFSTIDRFSNGCSELWMESCDRFAKKINKYGIKVILVKNYLTNGYGKMGEVVKWKNNEYIQRVNCMLNKYYEYLEMQIQNVVCIIPDKKLAYTDKDYRYGCYPWYYNSFYYSSVMRDVGRSIYKTGY